MSNLIKFAKFLAHLFSKLRAGTSFRTLSIGPRWTMTNCCMEGFRITKKISKQTITSDKCSPVLVLSFFNPASTLSSKLRKLVSISSYHDLFVIKRWAHCFTIHSNQMRETVLPRNSNFRSLWEAAKVGENVNEMFPLILRRTYKYYYAMDAWDKIIHVDANESELTHTLWAPSWWKSKYQSTQQIFFLVFSKWNIF